MNKRKSGNWKKFGFEFFSIFIAVISAFALNNWNETRKLGQSQDKILKEIVNGLEKDKEDLNQNKVGHHRGIAACTYFRKAFTGKKVNKDSLMGHYLNLTRDYISVQNIAGYETLKSKGLEVIDNDALRFKIISLYEYDYNTLRKLEEEYAEMQFHQNYFKEITKAIANSAQSDKDKNLTTFNLPLNLPEEEKKLLLFYLLKIEYNRNFILKYYNEVIKKVEELDNTIRVELE